MGIINLILGSSGAGGTTGATGGNSISYAPGPGGPTHYAVPVSYTHLRAHETAS